MTELIVRLARIGPVILVLALAAAWQLPAVGGLRLAAPDAAEAERLTETLDALPDEPLVLVGFDADLGTYAEVRPTVRALLADLLARDARLAFVSLTPEGRALGSAELARLARNEANPTRLLDLGFAAGAEAGLVDLTRDLPLADAADGAFSRRVQEEGIAAFDVLAVVGGNDLGPRSWIEQVAPRIGEEIPIVAVTPTVLLPEVQPYVGGGGLAASLSTPRDGAAYRETVELGNLSRLLDSGDPRPFPLLIGMLVAVAALSQALGARVIGALRAARAREAG
ncbi:MAG TPA: hypothetical protein VF364_04380 [Candidatus Limnocylindria bacterium]